MASDTLPPLIPELGFAADALEEAGLRLEAEMVRALEWQATPADNWVLRPATTLGNPTTAAFVRQYAQLPPRGWWGVPTSRTLRGVRTPVNRHSPIRR